MGLTIIGTKLCWKISLFFKVSKKGKILRLLFLRPSVEELLPVDLHGNKLRIDNLSLKVNSSICLNFKWSRNISNFMDILQQKRITKSTFYLHS